MHMRTCRPLKENCFEFTLQTFLQLVGFTDKLSLCSLMCKTVEEEE